METVGEMVVELPLQMVVFDVVIIGFGLTVKTIFEDVDKFEEEQPFNV
jgi:hypothetical protein